MPLRRVMLVLFSPSSFCLSSERGGGQGDLQQQRQPSGPDEEAQEGPDGLHGPPAGPAGAQLRAAEVPERPGPHGAGGLPQPDRHAGQDLVPEPEVNFLQRRAGGGVITGPLVNLQNLETPCFLLHLHLESCPYQWTDYRLLIRPVNVVQLV